MDRKQVFKEADRVLARVSRPSSVSYAATHLTRPNESPDYDRDRILTTLEANVAQDVRDAKEAIDSLRSKVRQSIRKRK